MGCYHSILTGMLRWVRSLFTPTHPEVLARMDELVRTICSATTSSTTMRDKAISLLVAAEQKVRRCAARHTQRSPTLHCRSSSCLAWSFPIKALQIFKI